MQIQIRPVYWVLLTMISWGGAIIGFHLLRLDAYGINEAAARALLIGWSVADKIASPAVTMGIPDLRALVFIPLGIYWPGNILAAKVFTLLITFWAAVLLYKWHRDYAGDEAALIAAGLLLIAPLTVHQVDSLGAGPYLLLTFALGRWIDHAYRSKNRLFGGWFFLQLIVVMFAVSLHPIGLAYPLSLLWEWRKNPLDKRHQKYMYIGIVIAVIFILLVGMGWITQSWLGNPYTVFTDNILGVEPSEDFYIVIGALLGILMLVALAVDSLRLARDLIGRMLILGVAFGLFAADATWVFISLAALLYCGIPLLIRLNQSLGKTGFMGQRGIFFIVLFLVALLFMQGDKAYRIAVERNALSPVDKLILTLSTELEDVPEDENIFVMSEWPGRTMLAIKRPSMPLPPPYKDKETLFRNIKGATHLVFDPYEEDNKPLADQLFSVSGATKTISLQEGGAIIRIIDPQELLEEQTPSESTSPEPSTD